MFMIEIPVQEHMLSAFKHTVVESGDERIVARTLYLIIDVGLVQPGSPFISAGLSQTDRLAAAVDAAARAGHDLDEIIMHFAGTHAFHQNVGV